MVSHNNRKKGLIKETETDEELKKGVEKHNECMVLENEDDVNCKAYQAFRVYQISTQGVMW